jgi:hypothetical protein
MTAAERRRAGMTVNAMDRFIDGIELAAAAFIGIVAIDIFVSVVLRYLFNASIPDSSSSGALRRRAIAAVTSRSTLCGRRRARAANV